MSKYSGRKPRAVGRHVMVRVGPIETKSAGGIVLTESTIKNEQLETEEAEVVEIGPLAWSKFGGPELWGIEVGDIVLLAKYSGKDFVVDEDGTKVLYRIINDTDCFGVYDREDEVAA